MSVELEMLVWVATLTLLMWIPYVLSGIINDGLVASLKWKGDEKPRFIANISNEATASAAMAYFWLRVIHYLFYTLGVSYIRTPAFIGSWLAQICIVYQILVN